MPELRAKREKEKKYIRIGTQQSLTGSPASNPTFKPHVLTGSPLEDMQSAGYVSSRLNT
jgi:hypothetical protein